LNPLTKALMSRRSHLNKPAGRRADRATIAGSSVSKGDVKLRSSISFRSTTAAQQAPAVQVSAPGELTAS